MVGVKLTITEDMQAGTLEKAAQLGAPGFTGFEKFGLLPVMLFGPKENPVPLPPVLFPDAL